MELKLLQEPSKISPTILMPKSFYWTLSSMDVTYRAKRSLCGDYGNKPLGLLSPEASISMAALRSICEVVGRAAVQGEEVA